MSGAPTGGRSRQSGRMVACAVADRTRERGRRERPRRPLFVEHVGRVPLSESSDAGQRSEAIVSPPRDQETTRKRADRGPGATPPVFQRAVAVDPVVVTADDVNRPNVESAVVRAGPLPAHPATPPTEGSTQIALWMVGGLAVGLAIGAIVGTAAALMVFG